MLPAAARLRRRAEFAAVVRGGRRAGRGAVVVHLTMPTAPPPAPAREPVADGVPATAVAPADPAEPIRAGTPTVPARFGMLGANPPDMVQAETMRVDAATTSVPAGTEQVPAETARTRAETANVQIGTARIPAGTARAEAEAVRVPAGTVGAEAASGSAEAGRVTAGFGGARAGFVVPRTVGGAVVRNRVRRRLRHLVAERLAALPAGAELVVRALPGAADRSYAELAAELDAALAAARSRTTRRAAAQPSRGAR